MSQCIYILKFQAELENVRSITFPVESDWEVDVALPGDVASTHREGLMVSASDEAPFSRARGSANLVFRLDDESPVPAALNVVKRITQSGGDIIEGGYFARHDKHPNPVVALEAFDAQVTGWKLRQGYTVTSTSGNVWEDCDFTGGEWMEVDPETNDPVSILSMKTSVQEFRHAYEVGVPNERTGMQVELFLRGVHSPTVKPGSPKLVGSKKEQKELESKIKRAMKEQGKLEVEEDWMLDAALTDEEEEENEQDSQTAALRKKMEAKALKLERQKHGKQRAKQEKKAQRAKHEFYDD
mmetsp:Transcript_46939/g.102053  ORF Transcript_46939/g.102053 Transcript_46939/m.102053 type:complete len:297 (-) Transcript_46939:118-1008(-)